MVVNVYTQGFSSIANGKINRAKVHTSHWLVKAHLGNGCIEAILGGQPHKLAHVHVCVCVMSYQYFKTGISWFMIRRGREGGRL